MAKIYDLQDPTAKMSKSSSSPQGIIDVLDDPAAIRKKIARAVTDAGSEVRADAEAKPGVTNLLRIYSALSGEPVAALEAKYEGSGYGGFKKDLAELVVASFAPIRERTEQILADEGGARPAARRGRGSRSRGGRADHGGRPRPHRPAPTLSTERVRPHGLRCPARSLPARGRGAPASSRTLGCRARARAGRWRRL